MTTPIMNICHRTLLFMLQVFVSWAFVPDDKKLWIDGNFILGGLFPITSNFQGGKCTHIQGEDGIQALEAMKYSIEKINKDGPLILHGIKLGMVGVDTCESETISLDNTLELIEMRINKKVTSDSCVSKNETLLKSKLIGIIGPASSKLSIPVASLLRLFKIPQISYQSTSPELSDKTRFEYFKRTVPSDLYQVKVIVEILKYMDYQYISIVYEDSSYGLNYKSELQRLSKTGEFCIGISLKLPYDQSQEENKYVINTLLDYKNTKGQVVVVLIVRPGSATNLFQAVYNSGESKSFHWIGTDGWTGRTFVGSGIESVINGAIGVQLLIGQIPGFKQYFQSLTVATNKDNPWFGEYKNTFNKVKCVVNEICDFEEFGVLPYINDGVLAFAYALKTLLDSGNGSFSQLETSLQRGNDFLKTLGSVQFQDSEGRRFRFLNSSEGPPRYSIMKYVDSKSRRDREWVIIGNYSRLDDKDVISFQNKKGLNGNGPSVCSEPCKAGYGKNILKNECCWRCTRCEKNQYSSNLGCVSCPPQYRTNNNGTNCTPISIEHMNYNEPAAIAALSISVIGIAACIFVIVVFAVNRETPLVKATDLKLSLVLICGLILSYGSSAVFLAKPSIITCGLTRCLLGLCYTLQYATILTKTIRIFRLFQAKSPEKKKFINSRSSITMTLLLTFFHVLGITAWIIFDSPKVSKQFNDGEGVLICQDADNFSYAFSLLYSVALLMACVIFAIKTRKIPDGFKETRFIAICSYTTCIIWLAFASTFFFTNNNTVRVLSLCITLSINSTVSLSVLFLSRIYIIMFKPKLNTRDHVMTRSKEQSDKSSRRLTANKSVGTDDNADNRLNNETHYLQLAPALEQNLAPFLPQKDTSSSSEVVDDMEIMNNTKDIKHEYLPLRGVIPRITVNGPGQEFNV